MILRPRDIKTSLSAVSQALTDGVGRLGFLFFGTFFKFIFYMNNVYDIWHANMRVCP